MTKELFLNNFVGGYWLHFSIARYFSIIIIRRRKIFYNRDPFLYAEQCFDTIPILVIENDAGCSKFYNITININTIHKIVMIKFKRYLRSRFLRLPTRVRLVFFIFKLNKYIINVIWRIRIILAFDKLIIPIYIYMHIYNIVTYNSQGVIFMLRFSSLLIVFILFIMSLSCFIV